MSEKYISNPTESKMNIPNIYKEEVSRKSIEIFNDSYFV